MKNNRGGEKQKHKGENLMKKQKNPDKIGMGKMLAWQSRGASLAVQSVLFGYLMVYCTNALGMSAKIVGIILMASKILDGFTDLVAGYLVDKTNTKIGRGRPYEVCILAIWLTTWLCFSVPESMGMTAKYIWVFVFYALTQSVFYTLLTANQTVYMVRAFHNEKKYITLNSIGGMLVTFFVIVFNVIFPSMEAKILNSASGWSALVRNIAIPLAIIGIMRFLFVKEEVEIDVQEEKVKFADVVKVLKTNKYIYFVAALLLIYYISTSLGVANYYYIYIVKNLSIMGVMSLFTVIAMFSLALYPALLKRMTVTRLIQIGLGMTVISGTLNFFAGANIPMLAIASVISGMSVLPISYMYNMMVIDCADYNEWKGIPRMEGTLTSITGFASKVGAALGSFLLGILLDAAKFDGAAEVQPDSAIAMIRFIFSYLPTIFCVGGLLILCFYGLDKLKPQIREDLEKKHAAAELEEQ